VPHVARLAVHPVKSLEPESRDRVRVLSSGALAGDREYAMVDADGEYVNGKRTAAVHRLRSSVAFEDGRPARLTLRAETDDAPERLRDGERVALPDAAGEPENDVPALLSRYFGHEVRLRRDRTAGFPDDTANGGPTVVSTATLERVAAWTDVSVDSVRRRFRANVEVGGVEPFWEDRLYAADGPVRFRLGDCELLGTGPCSRCVVPLRDPDTGEETPGFRERLVDGRQAELPEWAPVERFDHHFKLAVNTRRPDDQTATTTVAVGDAVELVEG